MIFLSYARDDDEAFTKKLYESLTKGGFTVWWDRVSMPSRALTFLQEIRDAIDAADRLILVIGPKAVTSEYVRAEWQYALAICKTINPVLRLGNYGQIPEVALLETPDFGHDDDYDKALSRLLSHLNEPVLDLSPLYDVPALPPNFLVRNKDIKALTSKVLADAQKPLVITSAYKSIVLEGMSGIGKSVLASAFAHSCDARQSFRDGIIWLPIGKTSEVLQALQVIGDIFFENINRYQSLSAASNRLSEVLSKRNCLIVLDDVWRVNDIKPFINAVATETRSRLLITSRDTTLATLMGAQNLSVDVLSEAESLTLLRQWSGLEILPSEATEIAKQCGYLPLALAMIGAMVKNNPPNRWQNVLHRLNNADLEKIGRQFPNYAYPNLMVAIQVSADALDEEAPQAKSRYLDFAVFADDVLIPEETLKTFWIRGGVALDPYDSQDVIDKLVAKSLLRRDTSGSLTIHDLQLDYVRKQTDNLQQLQSDFVNAYYQQCSAGWHTGPNDGFFFQHLTYHFRAAQRYDELYTLLTAAPNWMEAKHQCFHSDTSYVVDLESGIRDYHNDNLDVQGVQNLMRLWTARQVVNTRVLDYSDTDLKTLVWLGRENEAVDQVRLRPHSTGKIQGFSTIFQELGTRGNFQPGLIKEIEVVYHSVSDKDVRAITLAILMALRTQAGMPVDLGTLDEAWVLFREIQNDLLWGDCLRILTPILNYVGQLARLTDLAKDTGADIDRQFLLCNFSIGLGDAGKFVEANDLASHLSDTSLQIKALSKLVCFKVRNHDSDTSDLLGRIEGLTNQIQEQDKLNAALLDFAYALIDAQQLNKAVEIANRITDPIPKSYALAILAKAKMGDGDCLEQALQAAQTTMLPWEQAEALSNVLSTAIELNICNTDRFFKIAQDSCNAIYDISARVAALRNLGLKLAQLNDDRAAQIFDQALAQALKIEKDDGQADSLEALVKFIARAKHFVQAEQIIPLIKDEMHRSIAHYDLTLELAQCGEFKRAKEVAKTISDDGWRRLAFGEMAPILAKANDEDAEYIFELARKNGATLDILMRDHILQQMAVEVANGGYTHLSVKLAQAIHDTESQAQSLADIVAICVQRQAYTEAEQIIQFIVPGYHKSFAIGTLVTNLADSWQFEKAEQLADIHRDDKGREYISCRRALQRILQGETERGLEIALTVPNQTLAFRLLVIWLIENNRLGEATQFLEHMENSPEKEGVERLFVIRLAESGQYETAKDIARDMNQEARRAEAISLVSGVLSSAGNLAEAEALINEIVVDRNKEYAFRCLAIAEGKAKHSENARQIALSIPDSHEKALMLIQLGKVFSEAQDNMAEEIFKTAEVIAQSLASEDKQCYELHKLVETLAHLGEKGRNQALRVAQTIPNEQTRIEALGDVVLGYYATGDEQEAIRIANQVPENWQVGVRERDSILYRLASAQAKNGYVVKALDTLGMRNLVVWVEMVIKWTRFFEKIQPELSLRVLAEVTRIASWISKDWEEISTLLAQSES
ncbi:MAG: NB-ARC domain-containing protein [Aggregatilineales bacterium]